MQRQIKTLGGTIMTRNRIGYNDTIKAHSYDANGKMIAQVYDSGFTTIESVARRLSEKGSGWLRKISEIDISNEDKEWYGCYKVAGGKLIKQ